MEETLPIDNYLKVLNMKQQQRIEGNFVRGFTIALGISFVMWFLIFLLVL